MKLFFNVNFYGKHPITVFRGLGRGKGVISLLLLLNDQITNFYRLKEFKSCRILIQSMVNILSIILYFSDGLFGDSSSQHNTN